METKHLSELHSIQIETTSRCNLDCVTCLKPAYGNVWQERDMDNGLFGRILSQLPAEGSVHLQGWGEPLLHPDTLSHIKQLKARGSIVSFTTNGSVMDKTLADSLVDSGLDGITFSMAGNSASTQDSLRGVGSFELLQSAIRTFIGAKNSHGTSLPRVAVSYLLTPETVGDIPGAVSWCRKNEVDAFVTVHLTQAGCRSQQKLQFMVPAHGARRYQLVRIRAHLQALFGKMRLDLKPFHPTLVPVCDKNPLNSLFISADGDVSPCVFLSPPIKEKLTWYHKDLKIRENPLSFGNVRNLSLVEIWESPEYRRFRDTFRNRKEYHDRRLAGIGCSLEGSAELETAVAAITHYLSMHPPPHSCMACAKLDGF